MLSLPVRAGVTLACGCPTEPGGLWDSDQYEILARIVDGGDVLASAPLAYAGTPSTYVGELQLPATLTPGAMLEVIAMDPRNANFGMARRPLDFK